MKKHTKLILSVVLLILIAVGSFYKYRNYTYSKKVAELKKQEVQKQTKINNTQPSLIAGDSQVLKHGLPNSSSNNKSAKWSSSDANVATVNENGVVTAIKPGKATITSTAADGSKGTSYSVNVSPNSNKSNFSVLTEYSEELFGTKVVITLNGVAPADLGKYIVKYNGTEVKLHSKTNTFRLFVEENIDVAGARAKISVSSR